MLGHARKDLTGNGIPAVAPGDRDQDVYDRYAVGLYRQVWLALGDQQLAEGVVSDVLTEECLRSASPGDERDVKWRMAVSAHRRCRRLTASPGWSFRAAAERLAANARNDRGLCCFSEEEGAALGLVLFGGLTYAQASLEMGVPPEEIRAFLLVVLHRLAVAG